MSYPSLWALGTGSMCAHNISVLCANMYEKKLNMDKTLPTYMQRKDNQPLAYSFESLDLAKDFIKHELYNKHIDSVKIFDNNQMLYKYKKTTVETPLKDVLYSVNLIQKVDDVLTDFFLTTQTQLMFVTEIHEDDSGFDVNATLIDILENTDISIEHQHIFLDRLESNYKIDI